jgi:predicted nucleic acid-binding protein
MHQQHIGGAFRQERNAPTGVLLCTYPIVCCVRWQLDRVRAVAICWVTIGEIYEGAYGYADPHAHLATFRDFLSQLEILDLNDPIMARFAAIRSDLRRRGQLISDFDILLAATALHYDLIVLTHNIRHFSRIPDLKPYPSS